MLNEAGIYTSQNISAKTLTNLLIFRWGYDIINARKGREMIPVTSVTSAITNTISISQFNRGLAGQIFSDVKEHGPKVVMKNNAAEAVLVSPDEYVEVMNALNDYMLLSMAVERMENYDPSTLISEEEMDKLLGITVAEIDAADEVEFE